MTIFLCGFMGCGKTTAGKIIAKKLGVAYVDTDELIVKNEGMSIPDIFAQKGEPYFRQVEAETVKGLCGKKAVVACGGGAMLNEDTASYANENGAVVFLDVPFDMCYERIKGDENRPIVVSSTKAQLLERYEQRYSVYLKNSRVRTDCTGSPVENAEAVINALKGLK